MFGANHSKLKTNLKLAIQRLKLLEKKKTEMAIKSTKEIADYLSINKYDRARIKVEHIIREDYLVEGMEIVEMYCDLLLARFGLVESMKELDLGLYECVSSLIWVAPRLGSEVAELKIISDELQHKYGKEFAQMCRENRSRKVNEKLMQKMSEQAPGDLLVEKYLVEIAKSHQVPFKPNPELAVRDPDFFYNQIETKPNYPKNDNNNGGAGGGGSAAPMLPNTNNRVSYIDFSKPQIKPAAVNSNENPDFLFPKVPDSNFSNAPNSEQTDSFDDLTKRFENLKKK